MKALDTSILLALLEGEAGAREILKRVRGEEVATTEANLLELVYISGHGPGRSQAARRLALERLRRKITVLPIDSRAVDLAGRHMGKGAGDLPPLVLAMMATLEASGCDELLTRDEPPRSGKWRFKLTRVAHNHSK